VGVARLLNQLDLTHKNMWLEKKTVKKKEEFNIDVLWALENTHEIKLSHLCVFFGMSG
jgi:hypothetical protein